jgi:hypothetical protein
MPESRSFNNFAVSIAVFSGLVIRGPCLMISIILIACISVFLSRLWVIAANQMLYGFSLVMLVWRVAS